MDAVTTLRKLAAETVSEGTALWADDPDMMRMVWGDAAAMREVATLIELGQRDEAQERLDAMDTTPRERAYEALDDAGALA